MGTLAFSDDGRRYGWAIVAVTAVPWLVMLVGSSVGEIVPLVALGFLLGTPHVMATVGLYLQPGLHAHVRANPARYVVAPVALVVGAAAAFGLASPTVGQVLLRGFLVWQLHHFTKQNLGMFSFWCRAGLRPGPAEAERRLILATTVVGVMGLVLVEDIRPHLHPWVRIAGVALCDLARDRKLLNPRSGFRSFGFSGVALVVGRWAGSRVWGRG